MPDRWPAVFCFSLAQAGQQEKLSLPDLIEELTPYAESKPFSRQNILLHLIRSHFSLPVYCTETIPPQVRENITAMLHDFVARNVEDA